MRNRSRIACVTCPLFPLAARLRSEPELRDDALAIFEGNGHLARVIAATRSARKAGVRPGMTLPQARARLPGLVARARDETCEGTAQEVLLEIAESFSPRVERGHDGTVFLDICGLERRFPGESPEQEIGKGLLRALDREDLPARVGIAPNKLAAEIAAGLMPTPTLVPSGEEKSFLSRLPIARLSPQVDIARTLEQWGLHSIGDFARLPAAEVASRLGEEGRALHASARGIDLHPLVPRVPPPDFKEGMNLEWPLVTLEPFLFLARAALDRLCQRLSTQGLGCARLDFSLRLEPDGFHDRSIGLPSPTHDAKTLLTLVRLDLEENTPGAPVVGFTFSAHPDKPRSAQMSLFGPAALSPERLATTLARLFALIGPGRVGSPRTTDGHRPERFTMTDFEPPAPPKIRPRAPSARGLLAVRVLRPAREIRVQTRQGRSGTLRPMFLETVERDDPPPTAPGRTAPRTRARKTVRGEVHIASGPWQLEECWWSDAPVQREYWDVEMRGGGIFRVYRDRESRRWFVDGIYD